MTALTAVAAVVQQNALFRLYKHYIIDSALMRVQGARATKGLEVPSGHLRLLLGPGHCPLPGDPAVCGARPALIQSTQIPSALYPYSALGECRADRISDVSIPTTILMV
jgi:hypothetical protein